jgi:hypothetical protein
MDRVFTMGVKNSARSSYFSFPLLCKWKAYPDRKKPEQAKLREPSTIAF